MRDYRCRHRPATTKQFRFSYQMPWQLIKLPLIVLVVLCSLYWIGSFIKDKTTPLLKPQVYVANPEVVLPKSSIEVVQSVNNLVKNKKGTYGWYVHSLLTGETYGAQMDFSFTAASVNKIPIVVSFLKNVESQRFSLSDTYQVSEIDKQGGTGELQYKEVGTPYSYEKLVTLVGKESDNTATRVLANLVGKNLIQEFINSQGMVHTNIANNTTTPKEMGELLSSIYLNLQFKDKKLQNLFFTSFSDTDFEDRISKGVPKGTRVVHKIGNQIQVWNDCGLVLGQKPYTLCILTDGVWLDEAREVVPQISRLVWQYESQRT